MKNLTLIRHAETHAKQVFENDKDRTLTEIGLHQIENIAKQLKEKKCLPDYLLCSSAKRATQTAQLLCKKLNINLKLIKFNSILYSGDLQDILKLIFSLDLSERAFIIGHNPTMSSLAHNLCPATNSIILPTAGVISLNFDIINWGDLLTKQGKLLSFIKPKHE